MMTDRELWACANTLMQQHGANAWFAASTRADELLAAGALDGHGTFLQILNRITQLEALAPDGAVH